MIMKLAQLPLRERLGLLLAAVFIVIMLADAFVLKPAIRQLQSLDASIVAEETTLRQAHGFLQFEASIREQYEGVRDLLGVTGAESETIELFKNELDELALQHGVQLRSMRHLAPETTPFLVTYVIEVGDYETNVADMLRFLHAVNQAPGMMRIRDLSIASQTDDQRINGAISVTRVMTRAWSAGE